MLLNLALESQKKLTLNGDVSWLGLIPVSADESKDYEKLFAGILPCLTNAGKAGSNA